MALCISKKNEGGTGWPGRGGLVCDGVAFIRDMVRFGVYFLDGVAMERHL